MGACISFFSGAGGLDLGLSNAGFDVVFANDIEPLYRETYCQPNNFGRRAVYHVGSASDITRDVIAREARKLPREIDLLAGGPPCPPYSKSRFYRTEKPRGIADPVGDATLSAYLRLLEELRPKAFLFENVHGFAYKVHSDALRRLEAKASKLGYITSFQIINAADYGVPQIRVRFIMVGMLHRRFDFPPPTHGDIAKVDQGLFSTQLLPWRTAGEAIGDLDTDERASDEGHFAGGQHHHLLCKIPPGDNYLYFTEKRGHKEPIFRWRSRYWSFLLKLSPTMPSWTIQARRSNNMGPFHWRNRILRIEEVRRLQTFPDDWALCGTVEDQWRQLGNAVPPLLGEVIGNAILEQLQFAVARMHEDDPIVKVEKDGGPIRKLPNMNEFSPGVLGTHNIKVVLASLQPYDGTKSEMIGVISAYPKISNTPGKQKANRANNVLIGMSQCGLIEKDGGRITGRLSPEALEILKCPDDTAANKRFARHLLENCFGLELLDAINMIAARGEQVKLQAIREELRTRGFEVTENEGNASKIREWLQGTRVINSNWTVDEDKLHETIGAKSTVLASWHSLTRSKRVFLVQLKEQDQIVPRAWVSVRQIKKLAEAAHGRSVFPEGRLRADVIEPLAAEGWLEERGKGAGRGGDSGDVKALAKLRDIQVKLPIDVTTGIPVDLRDQLSTPLPRIFGDLASGSKHTKGLALELLAIRLSRDIGLVPVCFRERSAKTQGAEVDLVANGVHLHYSRWLLQCKNTATVHVHDIAKEVGMAVVMKAHVVAMVTTGRFSRAVQNYADGLASTSALQAVLIDGKVLEKYRASGGQAVIDWLRDQGYRVLTLKEPQVLDIEGE